jgi:threonine-phosphate decarboxylase
VDSRRILAGNGTTWFIYTACPALGSQKVLIIGPTYADYADACRMHHIEAHHFLTHADAFFAVDFQRLEEALHGFDTVFVCNPNNPTGGLIPKERLQQLCRAHPKTHFIIDESYLPFAVTDSPQSMVPDQPDNVSVLWSLSKIFGIPGVRAGFLIAGPTTVSRFQRLMQPWSLNSLAQAAVDYLGHNQTAVHDFIEKTRDYLERERQQFCEVLASRSELMLFPSQASYILMKLPQGLDAGRVCRSMARKRILIRNCHNFHGLSDGFVRVALKEAAVNQWAAGCLVEIVQQASPGG